MNQIRIARCMNALGHSPAEREAHAILSFLAGPCGALPLADQAAWDFIAAESGTWEDSHGDQWCDVRPDSSMALDEDQKAVADHVTTCVLYLQARGILKHHPNQKHFVRLSDHLHEIWENQTASTGLRS
jgi:hypothetical protein